MRLPIQVSVFVVRPDQNHGWEYLLLHRVLKRMTFWQPVTGGVEEGETIAQTAARELTEETGFAPDRLESLDLSYSFPPDDFFKEIYDEEPEEITVHVFLARVDRLAEPKIDPGEHDDAKWCSLGRALDLLHWWDDKEALQRVAEYLERA